jgi:hypothetical protein
MILPTAVFFKNNTAPRALEPLIRLLEIAIGTFH